MSNPARTLARTLARRVVYRDSLKLLEQLAMFKPNSAGRTPELASSARSSVEPTMKCLAAFVNAASRRPGMWRGDSETFGAGYGDLAQHMRTSFHKNGSDKSESHSYEKIYARIFSETAPDGGVVEIGLGSQDRSVLSHMDHKFRPGGSLRSFAELFPSAQIFGGDIDSSVLFTASRINTRQVDQLDPASLNTFLAAIPDGVAVFIDDGLHSPEANLNSLRAALPKLRPGGWAVIEDIAPAAEPIWSIVADAMADTADSYLIRDANVLVFAMQMRSEYGT